MTAARHSHVFRLKFQYTLLRISHSNQKSYHACCGRVFLDFPHLFAVLVYLPSQHFKAMRLASRPRATCRGAAEHRPFPDPVCGP